MKRTIALAAAMMGLGSLAGGATAQFRPAPPLAVLTDADDGRVLRLPVGAELAVRLPENEGTPYRWMLRTEPRVAQTAASSIDGPDDRRVVGGRRFRTFRLRLREGGRFPLIFGLRTSAASGQTVRQVQFTVDAREDERGDDDRPYPSRPRSDGEQVPVGDAQVFGETQTGFQLTRFGREIQLRLRSDARTGYVWKVLDCRNIDLVGPVLDEDDRGGWRQAGREGTTIVRLKKPDKRKDGFVTMVLVPRTGEPSRFNARKVLDYHFADDR